MSEFLSSLLRRTRRWRDRHIIANVDHDAIVAHIQEAGAATPRYLFMTMMSCGIAILGLLQSSAAVVIGAMLISPLMGPIMQLGFSLCVVDFRMMRRALLALLVGTLLALLMSFLIVKASPLREATSEIMARTQPTLFDLMVAVFSGLAGAYAAITRKGETIVGVAIATALMPPLAVVGYGLAVGSAAIAGNAFFLFMTNLLAIALSVTLVAKWYGFGMQNSPQHTAWQAGLIAATFLVLAVPLGLALHEIAAVTWAGNAARTETEDYLKEYGGAIDSFRMERRDDAPRFSIVAFVPHYLPGASDELQRRLRARLGRRVEIELHQSQQASDGMLHQRADMDRLRAQVASLETRIGAVTAQTQSAQEAAEAARTAVLTQLVNVDIAQAEQIAVVHLREPAWVASDSLPEVERRLAAALPGWTVVIKPEVAPVKAQATNDKGTQPKEIQVAGASY